jgi:RNA polymerase sigma factor (sigma-70 family)
MATGEDTADPEVTEIDEEMTETAEEITGRESDALETESQHARGLDRQLAGELHRARPGGATSSADYLRGLSGRPRLPVAAERRLVAAAQAGDGRAREELVEAFLPMIAGVARVYRGSETITRVELLQEGVVGLLRALERYDPGQGVPFWGYASWWVRQAMQQLIAELTRPIVLSDRSLRQLSALKRAHRAHLAARPCPTIGRGVDQRPRRRAGHVRRAARGSARRRRV